MRYHYLTPIFMDIKSLATLDLPMIVDSVGIFELKGSDCTLTMTNWFLQELSVIPRGLWGDVARRFIMIRWLCFSPPPLFPSTSSCRRHRKLFRPSRRGDSVRETFVDLLVQTNEGIEIPAVDRIRKVVAFQPLNFQFLVELVGARCLDASKENIAYTLEKYPPDEAPVNLRSFKHSRIVQTSEGIEIPIVDRIGCSSTVLLLEGHFPRGLVGSRSLVCKGQRSNHPMLGSVNTRFWPIASNYRFFQKNSRRRVPSPRARCAGDAPVGRAHRSTCRATMACNHGRLSLRRALRACRTRRERAPLHPLRAPVALPVCAGRAAGRHQCTLVVHGVLNACGGWGTTRAVVCRGSDAAAFLLPRVFPGLSRAALVGNHGGSGSRLPGVLWITLLATRAWLQTELQERRLFTVGGGRSVNQVHDRKRSPSDQPALEDRRILSPTDSPQKVGRSKSGERRRAAACTGGGVRLEKKGAAAFWL
ncbi:3'-N-debenzoyl-2'-deoxytaxol N-benzoyltransferase-like [Dorcoceras hygrometricum]|uniref:3'-N-debenzoyl-2'-deoxytaxol N-benzoyltransferase-like n=1 Tax=Dorcoceras hygrometricum TaxID=472368 RepID=A0A2Z7AX52_9LAMI|nr:3'-N-debenzoyl-2'-deoxytaxol N-benzoyltransferase-like [Dorcoceras hygrometricum]